VSITRTPSISITPSISVSNTPSVSITRTPSISITPSISVSNTPSISITATPTISITPSISVSNTPSISITATPTISITPSISVSATPSISVSPTPSTTPPLSPSITPSPTTTFTVYELTLDECCGGKSEIWNIAIADSFTVQLNDSIYVDVGDGPQCYIISESGGPVVVTPDAYYINYYENDGTCTACTSSNPCPSPTPTPSISITATPSVTRTPSVTPSLPEVLAEITACSGGATFLVSFTAAGGGIPAGPVTYLSFFPGGDVPNGCYTIVGGEPPIGPVDGVVSSIGDTSTTCIQCTGKPIPSISSTPSISITPTRTISITPSPTRTPSLTPTKTPTPSPCPVSTYDHDVFICTTLGTRCTKTSGYIRVNGVNQYSWGTAETTTSGNLNINPGDSVELSMGAIQPPSVCVNNGINYSDVNAIVKQGGSGGTTIFNGGESSDGGGTLSYSFTATSCNYYFYLNSSCS
jgi:hypothetical protein